VKGVKIRVSLVEYLNSAPLGWFFLHGPLKHHFEVTPATPAVCADQLARGEVDVGVIPSIEYQRIPGLWIIPGMSVSSGNRVRSVVMVRPGGRRIRSVALDTSSRTSVVLLKLLLRHRMGLTPEFKPHPPDLAGMLEACDAALLIGDAALRVSTGGLEILDLAESWVQWQRRPFVFAFWACRGREGLPENLTEIFEQAKDWGLKRRDELAEVYARRLKLSKDFLLQYLYENIDYSLEAPHREALEIFYRLAVEDGLIDRAGPIRFLLESDLSPRATDPTDGRDWVRS
jgi:chorismate dehydratase